MNPTLKTDDSFQKGWDAAQKRLEENGFLPPEIKDMEIKNLSGKIENIEGKKIILNVSVFSPLSSKDSRQRIVEISDSTKIYIFTNKDPELIAKEMENASPDSIAPLLGEKKEISLSDLKIGQQISVTANENIKEKKEFIATEIVAQEEIAIPTEPVQEVNIDN